MAEFKTDELFFLYELVKIQGQKKRRIEYYEFEDLAERVNKIRPDADFTKDYLYKRFLDVKKAKEDNRKSIGISIDRLSSLLKYCAYPTFDLYQEDLTEAANLISSFSGKQNIIIHHDSESKIVQSWQFYLEGVNPLGVDFKPFREHKKEEAFGDTSLLVEESSSNLVIHILSHPIEEIEAAYIRELELRDVLFIREYPENPEQKGVSSMVFLILFLMLLERDYVLESGHSLNDAKNSIESLNNTGVFLMGSDLKISAENNALGDFHQTNYIDKTK